MGVTTGIEWTDATWNPWMGCSKVSPGCDSCYMFTGMRRYGRNPEVVQRTQDATFDCRRDGGHEKRGREVESRTAEPGQPKAHASTIRPIASYKARPQKTALRAEAMSEELLQTIPQTVGTYTYYRLGSTTLDQLKNAGLIPQRNYGKNRLKKPDGLLKRQDLVKAVVEYKTPEEIATDALVAKAIRQEISVAKALCKLLILTDGSKTYWVNALNDEYIRDADGNQVQTVFHPFPVQNLTTVEYLIDEIDASISQINSTIRSAKLIDPSPLATRLWQTIWVATGKTPIKCLYNVVELFIFKFLSDLEILPKNTAFDYIHEKALANAEDALDYYARNTRHKIYAQFPTGSDGTTIINGTIFVNEAGDANLSQSVLFRRCLEHLKKYSEDFGSLTKIDKQFKTKLYESFLKEEVQALGQYFTPRKIVQSMIRMAGIPEPTFQFNGKRFCDGFCGVGGFPLEILNLNDGMMACYAPDGQGKINLPFVVHGFDKGFEREDERTIILAKANMLIYLSELLFKNPSCSVEFARIFNETFFLFKDNLATFGHIIREEDEKYDYIFTNPPYVTRGSSIIKTELKKTARTLNEYPVNALGLESIALQWIIKSLKRGGQAFVIIPDGILARVGGGGKKLRDHILKECYLNAIVSLPDRTFFANNEHTYILSITKKNSPSDVQKEPVFTYLARNIGERLTSVKREEIDSNDLPEMEHCYRILCGSRNDATKALIEGLSPRCKVQGIEQFRESPHWVIDRWWTKEDRIRAGIDEEPHLVSKIDVDNDIARFSTALGEYEELRAKVIGAEGAVSEVALGDTMLFKLFNGDRHLRKDLKGTTGTIPIYSANPFQEMGYSDKPGDTDFSMPTILWGIDGNFGLRHFPLGKEFVPTDHCGVLQVKTPTILPEYLLFAIAIRKDEESFDRSFRASLFNMRRFKVRIPITSTGEFDVTKQKEIAGYYVAAMEKRKELESLKKQLDTRFGHYVL